MQIVEIQDPIIDITKDNTKNNIAVGIDFGTTHSLIAIAYADRVEILTDETGQKLIPSIVTFDTSNFAPNNVIVGQDASEIDKVGYKSVRSIKRLLAKSTNEIVNNPSLYTLVGGLLKNHSNGLPQFSVGDKKLSVVRVATEIFRYLKSIAEKRLDYDIKDAVVSVPAYFDDNAKGQVVHAAKLAGFNVMRLIAEPTAAAYAYGMNINISNIFLVYDLGGGTFDVSILNMQSGVLQVIAVNGDNMLGGDDIDYILAKYIHKKYYDDQDQSVLDKKICVITDKLVKIAKIVKHDLSTNNESTAYYLNRNILITKSEFEQLIRSFVDKTINIVKSTILDAGNPDIQGIILVGGSTKVPMIKERLSNNFNVPIFSDLDPDHAVVMGAAMQARNLIHKSKLLIDVVPLSLGIELYGGLVEKIIPRNTPVPFAESREFTTQVDYQTAMKFHCLQGEREMAENCRSIAKFELKNLPPMKAGMVKVNITFVIDIDGILSITASESTTGIAHNIEVKPTYGMSEKDIDKELISGYKNARTDHNNRLLIDARLSAKNLIDNLSSALLKTPNLLSAKDHDILIQRINSLQDAINLDNHSNILDAIADLNKAADKFIELHLNYGATVLLEGKNIKDLEDV